ncbi:deoxyribodipyrimidine photo-lyase [Telmatocola sphagniphila]|uniref:Deoxyribodipyrimidine photo-lyase n=1 Tax=Telmatocola sphagniphila TaxID=1123043 RepID=A0A8E6B5V8_9BACT|nr:deoxyribodipyrimidine photo-lyase [Telmatocola sphagniphila]QVL31701.1 deoxyribodipyrimidine photo-lyase [Telmatocola sphagniphila]
MKCPFEADYPTLQHRLFTGSSAPMATPTPAAESKRVELSATDIVKRLGPLPPASDLVWVHDAAMSWEDPALKANPEAAVAFVFDEPALRAEPWAYHRLAFVLEGLEDLFEHLLNPTKLVLVGDPAEQLAVLANALGASTVHFSEHPNPTVLETAIQLQKGSKVIVHSRPVFAEYSQEPKRFSRYWELVAPQVLGYRPKSAKRMHQ